MATASPAAPFNVLTDSNPLFAEEGSEIDPRRENNVLLEADRKNSPLEKVVL